MKKVVFLAVLLLCSLSAAFRVFAQTAATGEITGTISDPSKGVIAQATVTATNEATGISRTVKTNADGDYVIPLLPPGNYTVTVEAAGFKTQKSEHAQVQ